MQFVLMPETNVNFVYKLDGDLRELDVFSLAPTLLSLGRLIQESKRTLDPDGRQIGVNVKPFREGSFIVELVLFPATNLQMLFDVFNHQHIEQIKDILTTLGMIAGTPIGVVQLIKWLRGKPKTVEPLGPSEIRYISQDNRSIVVGASVHQLFQNVSITNNINQVLARPLEEQPSIENIETYLEGEPKSTVRVDRFDIPAFKEIAAPAEQEQPKETIKENVYPGVLLNPKRGSFENDGREWSFYRGGEDVITATIKDKQFLADYAEGKYRLNASDLLTVDLLEKQTLIGTKLKKPTFEILRVLHYQKAQE